MKNNAQREASAAGLTLITGGTGKTGRRIAERLHARGVETRIASRSATPSFDWNDPCTWNAALDGVNVAYVSYSPDLAVPGATETIRRFVTEITGRLQQRLGLPLATVFSCPAPTHDFPWTNDKDHQVVVRVLFIVVDG